MAQLFSALKIREVSFRNRIFVSPMCQYSAQEGLPNDWHLVHLGSRAVGGASLILVEATAVSPEGRISPGDLGLWNKEQAQAFRRITDFVQAQGGVPGIQLAHAGRKASTQCPWDGEGALPIAQGWTPLAPTSEPFSETYPQPQAMNAGQIQDVIGQFVRSAELALEAGFQVVELHMAHGYLLHEFLSPRTNTRRDEFGGSLESRLSVPLQVAEAVRAVWPRDRPLFVRLSVTDWVAGGWDLEQSLELVQRLKTLGVDFVDCSTGGLIPHVKIPVGPAYQVPFAEAIRRRGEILVGAVGLITDPHQAESILARGQADAVLLARELLRDPYWPLRAAQALGAEVAWPKAYERAKPHP